MRVDQHHGSSFFLFTRGKAVTALGAGHPSQPESLRWGAHSGGENACISAALRRAQVAEREQPTGSLPRDREIAAISTLVFDSCCSRCPSDLSKSAQVQLSKNAEISGDYKFRTKTAKYRALEKNARRERISDLSASLTVQRFAD
jgi:hypothetical protein